MDVLYNAGVTFAPNEEEGNDYYQMEVDEIDDDEGNIQEDEDNVGFGLNREELNDLLEISNNFKVSNIINKVRKVVKFFRGSPLTLETPVRSDFLSTMCNAIVKRDGTVPNRCYRGSSKYVVQ